uniref:Uncharacterized protein n=1 Tax=virus sp. ctqEG8 TaxID=2827998 RepID=A0A8S5RFP0_9VIRU|nr:MAG TPA: hypothetical protein [virus sp. ctqEG8]
MHHVSRHFYIIAIFYHSCHFFPLFPIFSSFSTFSHFCQLCPFSSIFQLI